jgi:integrase
MPIGKKTETQPIKWKKAMMLLDVLKDKDQDNTRLMLACGFFFGLRISDILRLTWEDILQDNFILIESKTKKDRQISLDPKMVEIRDQVIKKLGYIPTGLIFVNQRVDGSKVKPISVVAANKRIKKVFEEYDIQCQNPSSHTLRKTFGLRVYENLNRCDDALILLSQMFNHADTSVTRRYIGITQRRITNVYLNLSGG